MNGKTGGKRRIWCVVGLLGILVSAALVLQIVRADQAQDARNRTPSGHATPSDHQSPPMPAKDSERSRADGISSIYTIKIRKAGGPPRIDLGLVDASGQPVTAACSTCHATRPSNQANRTPADLDEFHQDLDFKHGRVSCLSCHNPNDYDALRLADGRSVSYEYVMTLCSQCHGPQFRDFEHGAHGGMNGYWDLSRGPRTRNNCVDCHDPHDPRFPAMKPTFKPRDRFLNDDHYQELQEHE